MLYVKVTFNSFLQQTRIEVGIDKNINAKIVRVSQFCPVYPTGHVQVTASEFGSTSLHVAPFMQGLAKIHVSPKNK